MRSVVAALAALLLVALVVPRTAPAAGGKVTVAHGLSMYGDLKYGPGFTHFEYTAPAPPKGGAVKLAALGTFDSLNPFILKGDVLTEYVVETWIEYKMANEVSAMRLRPHPHEFALYFDA